MKHLNSDSILASIVYKFFDKNMLKMKLCKTNSSPKTTPPNNQNIWKTKSTSLKYRYYLGWWSSGLAITK